MLTQPVLGVDRNYPTVMRLPRTLSSLETYGFGLTGHVGWIGNVAIIHAALGPAAIFVWLPGTIMSILLILQVQRLGRRWPEISGGTPNYAARLLKQYPGVAGYVAIGYFIGWASAPAVFSIVLTDLIEANLKPLGISTPETILKVGFSVLAYVVALSGTRALAILHLFCVIPAIVFVLAFCVQGMGWLAFSSNSPGFFPPIETWHATSLHFDEWAKWFFVTTYIIYACETASSFVSDSQQPGETLRFLSVAAWLMPPVFLGGSWVVMRLATPGLGDSTFSNLLMAAKPFWGESASFLVTLLIAFSCLLNCATAVSNCPRILYQLALDGHLSPVFAFVSRRGVLAPALLFTFCTSLLCLVWGNLSQILMVTGTGYLASFMGFHLGLWLCRSKPEVLWPWWSLGFFVVEAVVLVVGGLAWSWQNLLMGLLLPIAILAVDAAIRRLSFPPFYLHWWQERYRVRPKGKFKDFVAAQVIVLILLICSATTIGWVIRDKFERSDPNAGYNVLVILLVTVAFVAVAIACWTTLPQVASIAEAREVAESLFITALDTVPDTILVLDETGVIQQANPAAEVLFKMNTVKLTGRHLNEFFAKLALDPSQWLSRSEHTFAVGKQGLRIVEAALSQRSNRKFQEYVVILRDITERKQSELALRQSEETARKQATQLEQTLQNLHKTQAQLIQTEKMSSLGQLVAGVSHEINNPVNFIYGNITHINDYTQDLLSLIDLYQHCCTSHPQIQARFAEIDFDFLIEDLPKTLSSMKVGASRIREIVLTLRNFSRLDEAEMKPVNIHEGIDSTLSLLQNRLKAKTECHGIQIIKEYGNLPEVECYAGQLNQVFMNVLCNAIDALEEKARREERERSKEHTLVHPSPIIQICTQVLDRDGVRISIKDNGPGMTDLIKTRLFDPFFTTKSIGEGTGLGLSISYQIVVDKHGGYMKCISELGRGAEFWIELPLRQKRQKLNAS